MPLIMIRCPVHAAIIPTGLNTEVVQFKTLPDCAVPLACPACEQTHFWRPKDAWVFGEEPAPARRNASGPVEG